MKKIFTLISVLLCLSVNAQLKIEEVYKTNNWATDPFAVSDWMNQITLFSKLENTNNVNDNVNTKEMELKKYNIIKSNFNNAVIEIFSGLDNSYKKLENVSDTVVLQSIDLAIVRKPVTVNQYICSKFYTSLVSMFLWLLISIFLLAISKVLYIIGKAFEKSNDDGPHMFCWLISVVIVIISFFCLYNGLGEDLNTMMKIRHSPKAYLVETVCNLRNQSVKESK